MRYPDNLDPTTQGERQALLGLRSMITTLALQDKLSGKRLVDELDRYCAARLHDIRMDAERPQAAKR